MSTPVPKRESVKVETSNSGRRYVSIRELIRGEMERLDREDAPYHSSNGNGESPEPDKKASESTR